MLQNWSGMIIHHLQIGINQLQAAHRKTIYENDVKSKINTKYD